MKNDEEIIRAARDEANELTAGYHDPTWFRKYDAAIIRLAREDSAAYHEECEKELLARAKTWREKDREEYARQCEIQADDHADHAKAIRERGKP